MYFDTLKASIKLNTINIINIIEKPLVTHRISPLSGDMLKKIYPAASKNIKKCGLATFETLKKVSNIYLFEFIIPFKVPKSKVIELAF